MYIIDILYKFTSTDLYFISHPLKSDAIFIIWRVWTYIETSIDTYQSQPRFST